MKRISLLILIALLLSLITMPAFADDAVPETIQFRSIEWFEKEDSVKSVVDRIEGIKPSWFQSVEENARLDSWYKKWRYVYTDVNVENAGVILRYSNAKVAGYTADLNLYFAYSIKDNKVQYSAKDAQFYMAKYNIEGLEDVLGAFYDLEAKLSQLYGAPEQYEYSHWDSISDTWNPQGSLWQAKDGSLVWLAAYYNTYSEKYDELAIIYAAPDVDGFLTTLDNQIKQETADNESMQRADNSSNFDGL